MSKEAMKLALEHAKRDERHLNHAETRYWCRMYRDIAEKAVEALAKPDFWEGYVPEPVKPAKQVVDCHATGVCVQSGLQAEQPAQQEPVATLWQHGRTGRTRITMPGDITDCDADWFKAADLYTSPPAQQEPVAWMNPNGGMLTANYINNFASGLDKEIHNIPLYTSPPAQRTWVGLTDEERDDILDIYITAEGRARAIEHKLKEKNT